jgi:hypothetical protein
MIDAWYIIVRAAETREAYEDLETAIHDRRDEYQPIAQFDNTYQQQIGVAHGGDQPTYAEVAAGSSSQNKATRGVSDAPPSYSAIVKGGKQAPTSRLTVDHKVQT